MKRIALILCLSIFGLSVTTDAATIAFTSSAAFQAALGGSLITETFEGFAPETIIADGTTVNSLTYSAFPVSTDGRVTADFNSLGSLSLAALRGAVGGGDDFFFPGESFTVTFPFAVNAVGIFFNVAPSPVGSLGITTSAGSATNGPAYDVSTLYFVGFFADSSFTSATFFGNANISSGYNVDNISYAAVPEPASMMLLGTGLAAAALRRRRSLRAASTRG